MDRISELHDELLLKILLLLPTKEVVGTMVLSKRWKFLWTLVPRLVYDDQNENEYARFSRFVDRSLLLHKAPTLETLQFRIGQALGAQDILFWTRAAENRDVRKLIIEIDTSSGASPALLPRTLYTEYTKLVKLELRNAILVDVSSPVSLPALKILGLKYVKYPGDEFVSRFLSSCIVLEHLLVKQCHGDNVTVFTIRVPSLKTLLVEKSLDRHRNDADGFVIDAPSLKWLRIGDSRGGFCLTESEMPKMEQANVTVNYPCAGKVLGSITSVKSLFLCLRSSKDLYHVGRVFHRLNHFTLCTCKPEWLNVLMRLLRDAPTLQHLRLVRCHWLPPDEPRPCWIEPSSVPKCLLWSLETLEWLKYEGTGEEKEVVAFILRNGSCLNKVIVNLKSSRIRLNHSIYKELSSLPTRSPTCSLIFRRI